MTAADPFAAIIGQPQACDLFRRAVAHERVAHAYLIVGPAQTGKATLAMALGAALIGQDPAKSADWRAWSPEGKGQVIKIDSVRQLIQACTTAPLGAGYQVFAVFGAEALNRDSGNALLKTLEEPPPRTVVILTAERLESVLPTIRSRVQLIPTALVPTETIREALLARGVTADLAMELAQAAGGRIGWALQAADESTVSLPWPAEDPHTPMGSLALAKALGELNTADLRATLAARLRARWAASGAAMPWAELVALESAIAHLDAHVNGKLVVEALLQGRGER